jgi:hypothetical protein
VSLRVLLAAVALAASAGAGGAVAFSQADLNQDGVVTLEEAQRVFPELRAIHFRKCDPNGDGVIEKNEFALLNNFYWIMYEQR